MPRDYNVFLEDILSAIKKIEKYTKDLDFKKFTAKEETTDAVIRNLEIIGEAVKSTPNEIKSKNKNIEWQKIAGLRDILIHQYFGVDLFIVWDIVKNKLPLLKKEITNLL